ncbi:cyclic lactone autoinducer peptide [Ruminococcus bicirculans (ex Wegman et al. 2014)]|uniref:cyclic lactone autoinducer peptide n=1 Tax=Ruminococcus bicirculans (ex Wegman et al. 2014) TaxID=1160721 RepID=UPI003FD8C2AA
MDYANIIPKAVKNMKAIKKLMLKYGSSLAALALMIGVSSSSQACWWWYNQPKEPEGMKKFVKED